MAEFYERFIHETFDADGRPIACRYAYGPDFNYGYDVADLGRDVAPQAVVDAVVADHVRLVGLSALMTTTVPAMAETIELLRKEAPWAKVIVGGAVLNPEYAQMVGADYYAKDATETARIAGEVLG